MAEIVQHVIVTLVALGAGAIIVRRVFAAVSSKPSGSPCASCPSAARHGMKPPAPVSAPSPSPSAQPMILVRRGTRDA